VVLEVYDEEWVQAVDYEHVPFRCRKCHEHGHLFRDCPQNKRKENPRANIHKDPEGFTKIGGKGKGEGRRYQKNRVIQSSKKGGK